MTPETGFYYLQTRYYDPQVGRFLNADSIIGANGGIIGFNLFAYCGNNPIPNVDFNGNQFLRWQDYELGSMESTILFCWECYHYCQDNFGFTGDIDFDKLPLTKRQNSIDAFISAMEEVNFQAPPALIERYNAYVGSSIPVNSGTIRTASAGITISFGFVAVQISYVASESSESEIQSTVILNNSPSFSMTFGLTYSNAPNPSSMRGGTFFAGYGMPIFSTKYISI